jgi:hypothetical protein
MVISATVQDRDPKRTFNVNIGSLLTTTFASRRRPLWPHLEQTGRDIPGSKVFIKPCNLQCFCHICLGTHFPGLLNAATNCPMFRVLSNYTLLLRFLTPFTSGLRPVTLLNWKEMLPTTIVQITDVAICLMGIFYRRYLYRLHNHP